MEGGAGGDSTAQQNAVWICFSKKNVRLTVRQSFLDIAVDFFSAVRENLNLEMGCFVLGGTFFLT